MKICSIEGCGFKVRSRGLCSIHYERLRKFGRLYRLTREEDPKNYVQITENGVGRRLHVVLAEKALGKPLPKGAEVHHFDGNSKNNNPTNLIICPSLAYHKLLHQRQSALDACGNADYLKCPYCKGYDDRKNLTFRKPIKSQNRGFHQECENAYHRKRREEKRRDVLT